MIQKQSYSLKLFFRLILLPLDKVHEIATYHSNKSQEAQSMSIIATKYRQFVQRVITISVYIQQVGSICAVAKFSQYLQWEYTISMYCLYVSTVNMYY